MIAVYSLVDLFHVIIMIKIIVKEFSYLLSIRNMTNYGYG